MTALDAGEVIRTQGVDVPEGSRSGDEYEAFLGWVQANRVRPERVVYKDGDVISPPMTGLIGYKPYFAVPEYHTG